MQALLAVRGHPDRDAAVEPVEVAELLREPPSPVIGSNEPGVSDRRAEPAVGDSAHVAAELPPRQPGAIETTANILFSAIKGWVLGGNTIVRVGLLILFVGLSLLASYAALAGLFPVELRLTLIALAGITLLAVGFRTRVLRPGFGLALQGAVIATVYLTLFAAARLYDAFPIAAAFLFMIMVCALGCALALLQRSQATGAAARSRIPRLFFLQAIILPFLLARREP